MAGTGRNILLFSDGTGNSSAKAQKTNVWRLYEALDLGPPTKPGERQQIACYDDGVGTSSVPVIAMLTGALGIGLTRNVRDLYKFLCRNHREGDRIHAFGFSRGAFTVRVLAGFIANAGIVDFKNESDLDLQVRDAWREHRRNCHTNNPLSDGVVTLVRAGVRGVIRVKRRIMGERGYASGMKPLVHTRWLDYWLAYYGLKERAPAQDPKGAEIAFVGVWDTVAAFGGPLVELTRFVDDWVWPLTMSDYRLSSKVRCARHALAIDDKRDAFTPLLWDETAEPEPAKGELPRLQQVWFTGMHADVGGGYADDSLSFVSLKWMIEHLRKDGHQGEDGHDVRLIPSMQARIYDIANMAGPIHDSRGGSGLWYRYQPRYIAAWVDRPDQVGDTPEERNKNRLAMMRTRLFRDQTIDRGQYINRGFLKGPVAIHKSVEERLFAAADGYAPNNIPADYVVDDGIRGTLDARQHNRPEAVALYEIGDRIKLRRFWHFLFFVSTFLLVAMPFWKLPEPDWLVALTRWMSGKNEAAILWLDKLGKFLLPDLAARWTEAFAKDPVMFLALAVAMGFSFAMGRGHERKMADHARSIWKFRLGPEVFGESASPRDDRSMLFGFAYGLARLAHRTPWFQAYMAFLKWRAVPAFVLPAVLAWLCWKYWS